ncbi:DNA-binding response OmpR family regulator [Okibacterium sp. HSC-33S16]|uniref:response regulator transcription factor n=1 Tax=Okibacterium sp. HSC-33S16 TaxID=2910965 RepID=UPI00209F634B|nr:response regulator transcription factor [Okibacterium sp. HSC-33S16]MCP2031369.1 DNA-binding response OmpR family regulator [Okibacterium sp. HSC-33S16]
MNLERGQVTMGSLDDGRRVAVVIEDQADIRHLLEVTLTQAGFDVAGAGNGIDGIQAVHEHNPVVTTLDLSMSGMDGFEVARRIREFSNTYLMMVTARDSEIDTLSGLQAGADDYLTKPFRPRELRARIAAMLRRPRTPLPQPTDTPQTELSMIPASEPGTTASYRASSTEDWVEHNGLRLSTDMRLAVLDDTELHLTRTEFDLLAAVLEGNRRVQNKGDLALLARGDSASSSHYVTDTDKRSLESHLSNLRHKLGDSLDEPRWIETVRGVGYRLAARK